MRVQGVISLKEDQINDLFGKLGTHSKCAGATLWVMYTINLLECLENTQRTNCLSICDRSIILAPPPLLTELLLLIFLQLRDAFFADYRGRKVTISAPSQHVAACAIRTILFQLSNKHGTDTALTTLSTWNYVDRKQETHGPYPFHKMLHWAEQNAFHDESLPVQHSILKCWIPLWCLPLLNELANNNLSGFEPLNQPEEVAMEDWEATVRQLNEERSKGLLDSTATTTTTSATRMKKQTSLSDFPELLVYSNDDGEIDSSSAAPMDYELSHAIAFDVAPDSVRAFVVVDTNILLSHMSFTERVFEKLTSSGPRVEVLLLVPWIVLNELDRLKDAGHGGRGTSDAARLALRRIRALTSARDSFVHAQSAAEHEKVVVANDLPNTSTVQHRELRNDDLILQTCLHWHRRVVASLRTAGHRAAVFLLSNDKGLCTRAEANGVRCFSAMEFPGTVETLANQVPAVEPVSMEEAAAVAVKAVEKKVEKIEITENDTVVTTTEKAPLPLPVTTHPALIHCDDEQRLDTSSAKKLPGAAAAATNSLPHRLDSIIERCLAPGIKYYRQQDLGDLWIEMLEERSRPPWRAAMVLDVLCTHSTTFWEFLSRTELDQARQLERYLKRASHHHGHRSTMHTIDNTNTTNSFLADGEMHNHVQLLQTIMEKLLKGLDTPRHDGTDPPNPSEVPDFISLGDARGALQEGIEGLEQWTREKTA
jgi:rRNA-processing protein FCF1